MVFQKVTLSNPTNKNTYFNYVNIEGQLISQKLLPPGTSQTIWIIEGSLVIAPGFAQFIVEDEVEGIIPAVSECDAIYCLENCCTYKISARSGLKSWRYIDCEGTEVNGILNGGQSITICASFTDSIVAEGCEITLIGCCPQFPPQTPSNTPTNTPTPSPIPDLPGYYFDGTCGTQITQNSVGIFDTPSVVQLGFDLGDYVGPVTLTYNSFSTPDNFKLSWNTSEVESGFRSSCFTSTPQTCSSYNNSLLAIGYTSIVGGPIGTLTINKSSSSPSQVFVTITSPLAGTDWTVSVECVSVTPTPTTTQTPSITPTLPCCVDPTMVVTANQPFIKGGVTVLPIVEGGGVVTSSTPLTVCEYSIPSPYMLLGADGSSWPLEFVLRLNFSVELTLLQLKVYYYHPGDFTSEYPISFIINGDAANITSCQSCCADIQGNNLYPATGIGCEVTPVSTYAVLTLTSSSSFTDVIIQGYGEYTGLIVEVCSLTTENPVSQTPTNTPTSTPTPTFTPSPTTTPSCGRPSELNQGILLGSFFIPGGSSCNPNNLQLLINIQDQDAQSMCVIYSSYKSCICDQGLISVNGSGGYFQFFEYSSLAIGETIYLDYSSIPGGFPGYLGPILTGCQPIPAGFYWFVDDQMPSNIDDYLCTNSQLTWVEVELEVNGLVTLSKIVDFGTCNYSSVPLGYDENDPTIACENGRDGVTSYYYYTGTTLTTGTTLYMTANLQTFAPDGYYSIVEDEVEGIRIVGGNGEITETFVCSVPTATPTATPTVTPTPGLSPTPTPSQTANCDESYCLNGCCSYILYNNSTGLRSWSYYDCNDNNISGIIDPGSSLTFCSNKSFGDIFVDNGCVLSILGCCSIASPTPTPSVTKTSTPTQTNTTTPTNTTTVTQTNTPTPTNTPTIGVSQTPTPTNTTTVTQTNTTTPTPTVTPTNAIYDFGLFYDSTEKNCGSFSGLSQTYYTSASTLVNSIRLYKEPTFVTYADDGFYLSEGYAVYRITGGTGQLLGTTFCNTCECLSYQGTGGTYTIQYTDCAGTTQQVAAYEDGGIWFVEICGSNASVISGTTPEITGTTTNCVPSIGGQSCTDLDNCSCYSATGTTGSTITWFDCAGVEQTVDFGDVGGQLYSFCSLTTPIIVGTGSITDNSGPGFCYDGGGPGPIVWTCAV
jgi:hypothetical protein